MVMEKMWLISSHPMRPSSLSRGLHQILKEVFSSAFVNMLLHCSRIPNLFSFHGNCCNNRISARLLLGFSFSNHKQGVALHGS